MVGTFLNTATVLVGSSVGSILGARLSEKVQSTLMDGIGLVTILIGMKLAWGTKNEAVVLIALMLGSAIGELVNIEGGLDALGCAVERRFSSFGEGDFVRAVVGPTLLFCVGPLTLMGCIQEGITGNYSLLATKSTLDAFSSMAFGAALGWKVALSAVCVFLIQGSLTASAGILQHVLTEQMRAELFATGGVILLGLGMVLLGIKKIRVANMLPSLAVAPAVVWAVEAVRSALR
jgi:uncharacterized membrane protein YqgA involved in biofilm formation